MMMMMMVVKNPLIRPAISWGVASGGGVVPLDFHDDVSNRIWELAGLGYSPKNGWNLSKCFGRLVGVTPFNKMAPPHQKFRFNKALLREING